MLDTLFKNGNIVKLFINILVKFIIPAIVILALCFMGFVFYSKTKHLPIAITETFVNDGYHMLTIKEYKPFMDGRHGYRYLVLAQTEKLEPYSIVINRFECPTNFLDKMIESKIKIYYPYEKKEIRISYLKKEDKVSFEETTTLKDLESVFCHGKLPLKPE